MRVPGVDCEVLAGADERINCSSSCPQRYLEQQSFPLTEEEYLNHLEAVTRYLKEWGHVEFFIQYVRTTKDKPRVAKAVAVPIDLPADTARRIKMDLDTE